MTSTGAASQMRDSEFFRDKQLFPGYRPMGLSRISACLQINAGRSQRELSKYNIGSRENDGMKNKVREFTRVRLM